MKVWETKTIRIIKVFPGNSAGKESACNSGDPSSISGLRRSAGEGIGYPLQYSWASLGSAGKESACNAGDLDLIPGLEDILEKKMAYPLQYSGLENSMDQSMGLQRVGHN